MSGLVRSFIKALPGGAIPESLAFTAAAMWSDTGKLSEINDHLPFPLPFLFLSAYF